MHLESLNYPKERMRQLKIIEEMNEKVDLSIIAGDFNFTNGWEENKAIETYTDVWKIGKQFFSQWAQDKQKESGYTMPMNRKYPAWRPDHVIYRWKVKKER